MAAGAGSDGGAEVRQESRGGDRGTQSSNGTMWYEVLTKLQTFSCL